MIALVNPLGSALRHYTDALEATTAVGVRLDVDEPSVSGRGRLRWLLDYVRALRTAARMVGAGGTVVVTWPVVGYLDLLVIAVAVSRRVRVMLVLHDPEPLVRAVGHGPFARLVARPAAPHAGIVVHGADALAAVTAHGFGPRARVLPHPVMPGITGLEARPAPASDRPVLRVLGQYKPDRDVRLLAELAPRLQSDYRLEVHGRGWPAVPGWSVTDAFVSERRLDELVGSAAAVLVPYRRFFQSGIAVRALELGTPFVGPRTDALEAIALDDVALVDPGAGADAWARAIHAAVRSAPQRLAAHAADVTRRASVQWHRATTAPER